MLWSTAYLNDWLYVFQIYITFSYYGDMTSFWQIMLLIKSLISCEARNLLNSKNVLKLNLKLSATITVILRPRNDNLTRLKNIKKSSHLSSIIYTKGDNHCKILRRIFRKVKLPTVCLVIIFRLLVFLRIVNFLSNVWFSFC